MPIDDYFMSVELQWTNNNIDKIVTLYQLELFKEYITPENILYPVRKRMVNVTNRVTYHFIYVMSRTPQLLNVQQIGGACLSCIFPSFAEPVLDQKLWLSMQFIFNPYRQISSKTWFNTLISIQERSLERVKLRIFFRFYQNIEVRHIVSKFLILPFSSLLVSSFSHSRSTLSPSECLSICPL